MKRAAQTHAPATPLAKEQNNVKEESKRRIDSFIIKVRLKKWFKGMGDR